MTITPADIDSLVVTCGNCTGEIIVPVAKDNRFPTRCGQCDAVWFTIDSAPMALDVQLLQVLRSLRQAGATGDRATALRVRESRK